MVTTRAFERSDVRHFSMLTNLRFPEDVEGLRLYLILRRVSISRIFESLALVSEIACRATSTSRSAIGSRKNGNAQGHMTFVSRLKLVRPNKPIQFRSALYQSGYSMLSIKRRLCYRRR